MTMRGACLDAANPSGCPDPRTLGYFGLNGGRLVAKPDWTQFFAYVKLLNDARMELAILLDLESFATSDYQTEAAAIAQNLEGLGCRPIWIIGNEQDAGYLNADSPSSTKMAPEVFGPFFTACATGILAVQPNAWLVIGGFVGGVPKALADYIAAIRQTYKGPIKGYDLHPYSLDATQARDCFEAYDFYREPSMWGFCFEWNRPAGEIAEYVAMLGETGWCYFCWSDGEVDGYGLVDGSWTVKPEGRAMARALP